MGILLSIVLFIIGSICAAAKGDTSGLEVIFSILMVFGLFYLIYKVGMFGAFIIGLIFLVIVFAIAVSNDKNEKK